MQHDHITPPMGNHITRILEKLDSLAPEYQAITELLADALADTNHYPLDSLSLSLVKLAQELCNRGKHPVTAVGLAMVLLAKPVTAEQVKAAMDELERRFSGYPVKPWEKKLIRAGQLQPGMVFKCTSYPGAGIRTCRKAWVRKVGGETTVVIDCGEGISPLELSPSDELEVQP